MVLHLQTGFCASGVDSDLVADLAFECHQGESYTSNDPDFDFECPTCQTPFASMGALLQHAESDYCDEDLDDKRLRQFLNFLRSRVCSFRQ